jgi:hypothetical protein
MNTKRYYTQREATCPERPLELREWSFATLKALEDFSLALRDVNILVGPNNSGKSTIISALRVLDSGIRFARNRAPSRVFIGESPTQSAGGIRSWLGVAIRSSGDRAGESGPVAKVVAIYLE